MQYNPITVTDLNKYIKGRIDNDEMLNNVLVKGEISNFKNHYTGHMYFTLKDENSLIKCVMFKTYTTHLSFMPKDGMKVIVLGGVSVFERDGVYQIYAKAMKEDGLGNLYVAYEELKNKLSNEGLFDEKYKKQAEEKKVKTVEKKVAKTRTKKIGEKSVKTKEMTDNEKKSLKPKTKRQTKSKVENREESPEKTTKNKGDKE